MFEINYRAVMVNNVIIEFHMIDVSNKNLCHVWKVRL